jgi:hypothetical protein
MADNSLCNRPVLGMHAISNALQVCSLACLGFASSALLHAASWLVNHTGRWHLSTLPTACIAP